MSCDDAGALISARLDGALDATGAAVLDDHLSSCGACPAYAAQLERIRGHLRSKDDGDAPDVVAAVLAEVAGRPPLGGRDWLRVAAVFVAFALAGAVFIGLARRTPPQVAAADIPALVLEAQRLVPSLTAGIDVIERGWHPDVPERRYTGSVAYRAPEMLTLTLADATAYPNAAWVPNDTELIFAEGDFWSAGPAPCPAELQPGCTPPDPRAMAVTGLEPFPDAFPLPLDLIVPVRSFTRAAAPELLGVQEIEGRAAIVVAVTAGQVDPLLRALRHAGNWREVHPTDRVELWLDRTALVPLAMAVYPADDPDRSLWAARNGYAGDDPAVPVLEVRWRDVQIGAGDVPLRPIPADAAVADAGFRPAADVAGPEPGRLPAGLEPHRTGTVRGGGPEVSVRSWSDGRAWVKVVSTTAWPGGRLFGDLGDAVKVISLGEGTAYLNGDGTRVAIHAPGLDVMVTGSVGTAALLDVAGSLRVPGIEVPDAWAEAATATLADAAAAVPGLPVPATPEGFGEPAVRVAGGVAALTYTGPGIRSFTVAASPGELSPPLEAEVRAVDVRGIRGRYTPGRGTLEWVEDGVAVSITSPALSLAELLAIAASMG